MILSAHGIRQKLTSGISSDRCLISKQQTNALVPHVQTKEVSHDEKKTVCESFLSVGQSPAGFVPAADRLCQSVDTY